MFEKILVSNAIFLSLTLLACSPRGPSGSERIELVLPQGDADAGKLAFLNLGCSACHAVSGVEGLPATVLPQPGPDLATSLAGLSRGGIATGVIAPSHVNSETAGLWTDWEAGQRVWLGPGQQIRSPEQAITRERSRMSDYRSIMTVEQLGDLVSFLEVSRK